MADATQDQSKTQTPEIEKALSPELPPAAPVEAPSFGPGWHVVHEGALLGTYETQADAEDFANGHPRANGLKVEVVEG